MDSFWIIAIIAVVLSLFQKTKKPQGGDTTQQENNPQEEWERRLRELFGDNRPSQSGSSQEAPRIETPTNSAPRSENTPTAAKTPTFRSRQEYDSTQINRGLKGSNLGYNQHLPKQKGRANAASMAGVGSLGVSHSISPIGKESVDNDYNPEIGQILDEFSMERAVIYSEILKPKFEEDI